MELTNTFVVDLPIGEAWHLLTDAERVVNCLPGAAFVGAQGDDFDATVKIKVGPISANYSGSGSWLERDATNHRAVLRASGKDVGGQGGAAATVTLTLSEQGAGTAALVVTDLALSGRVAQFGRGVVADVSNKMLAQFVSNLKAETSNHSDAAAVRPSADADRIEPFDAGSAIAPLMKRYAAPIVGAILSSAVGGLALHAWRTRDRNLVQRRAATSINGPMVIHLILGPETRDWTKPLSVFAEAADQTR